jgi:hypothetical protein
MTVDHAHDVELPGCIPESGCGTKIALFGIKRAAGGLGKAGQKLLSSSEVGQNSDFGLTVLIPKRLDDAPVAFAADGVALKARLDSSSHDRARAVNMNRGMLLSRQCFHNNRYWRAAGPQVEEDAAVA